jgi:DNA-binding XRE family transcriptional regulator
MFGQLVREHRRRLGLSQEELAERAGVSVRSIGKIEAGRIAMPRPATVRLLADAFGLHGNDRHRFCQAAAGAPPAAGTVPALLPPDVHGFTGRGAELDRLDALLTGPERSAPAVVITAVSGTAGVGKTALAVHWAHQIRNRFPDGQLYVNLRGFDPSGHAMDPAVAVRGFLDALEVRQQRIPATPDAQAALYRSLIADKRMLIVLDNARDTAQVRPLLPGTPGCLVVVTSRNQLTSLIAAHGAYPLILDLLTTGEARDLLAHRLGVDRIAVEPDAVTEIIARCARLPLPLTLVAARAALRPHTALQVLAEELCDAQQRWQILTGDDPATDVRSVFSWSYRALTPDSARLFRLLGMHPSPDIAVPATASLAALPVEQVRPLLAELIQANLLTEHLPGRYNLHDLLRAYATHLTQTLDTDTERHAATHRVIDHYLHTAYTAERLLNPTRPPITLAPAHTGVTPERLTDNRQALHWFIAEHAVLMAAINHVAVDTATRVRQLVWTLRTFLFRNGHWHDWAVAASIAVTTARCPDNPAEQARAHRDLADAYNHLGRLDDAQTHLSHALDLYTRAGDQAGQAATEYSLAYLWELREQPARALDHARRALQLYQAAGSENARANVLNVVGFYQSLLGDHESALADCRQALTLLQKLDDQDGQANAWDSLGYAHRELGHYAQALTCYHHALGLYQQVSDRVNEAETLLKLGDTHAVAGNITSARDAYRQSLAIFDDLDHPEAENIRTKLAAVHNPAVPSNQPPPADTNSS